MVRHDIWWRLDAINDQETISISEGRQQGAPYLDGVRITPIMEYVPEQIRLCSQNRLRVEEVMRPESDSIFEVRRYVCFSTVLNTREVLDD